LYQTLLAARRTWPPLLNRSNATATIIDHNLIRIERGAMVAMANLSAEAISLPSADFGDRQPILSTAELRFGGQRSQTESFSDLSAYELIIGGDAAWK
jgi:hypothetical protein